MISMLKRFFEINYFFSNILVPVIALALYCGSFAYFSSRFLLEGVNYFFVSRLGKYVFLIMVGAILTFFVILNTKKGGELTFKSSTEKPYLSDILFFLLPLTPVIQYVINNQEILSPVEALYVVMCFIV